MQVILFYKCILLLCAFRSHINVYTRCTAHVRFKAHLVFMINFDYLANIYLADRVLHASHSIKYGIINNTTQLYGQFFFISKKVAEHLLRCHGRMQYAA